jgi:hypothetical protein
MKDRLIFQIKPVRIIFYSEQGFESFGTSERFDPADAQL